MVERSPGNPLHSVHRIGARGRLAGCVIGAVVAALLAGPENCIPTQPSPQAAFTSGATAAQIPIEMIGSSVIVPVQVNGGHPLSFLLDSGANMSAITIRRAWEQHLEVARTASVRNMKQKMAAGLIANAQLELPGVRVFVPWLGTVAGVPSSIVGHPIQGLLGADVLSRFVVEIDYARQTLQFYDPQAFRYAGHGAKLPLRLVDGVPYIAAQLEVPGRGAVEGDFLLDTGSGDAVVLSALFVVSHRLVNPRLKTIRRERTPGEEPESGLLTRLAGLKLGPYRLAQPIASIQEMRGTDERNYGGIIGSEVLRRFTVILDLPDSRLILEPSATFREPFETDMSGIAFIAAGANLGSFEVRSVLSDSPAAQAGVRSGDVLVALDGEPAQSYTLADIRRLFQQEGHTHKLLLRRGSEQIAVEFTPRRLL